jgi:hypothetical protein
MGGGVEENSVSVSESKMKELICAQNSSYWQKRLLSMTLSLLALVSCDINISNSSKGDDQLGDHVVDSGRMLHQVINLPPESTLAMRADYIKRQIEKYKEWTGGHSPIPRRTVTANTFDKVRQKVDREDSSALLVLVQDDAYDVRSIAASLLECVDSNAESNIEKQMNSESNIDRRNRFREALIQIRELLKRAALLVNKSYPLIRPKLILMIN